MPVSYGAVFFQFVCFLVFLGICFDIQNFVHLKALILIYFAWKVLPYQEPWFLCLLSYTFYGGGILSRESSVVTGFLLTMHADLWRTDIQLPIQKHMVCFSNYLSFPLNLLVKTWVLYIDLWTLHFFSCFSLIKFFSGIFYYIKKLFLLFRKLFFFFLASFTSIHWISWTLLFLFNLAIQLIQVF